MRQLVVLACLIGLCQAHIVQLRLQEVDELPGFSQRILIADGGQQMMSTMHSPINPLPSSSQPLFGEMQHPATNDWDSWMDSQFNAMQAMNQAVLGRRGGCGGHLRRESFGPILVQGVPSLTTPAAVLQRLASARFGNDLLKALIESSVQADSEQDIHAAADYVQENEDTSLSSMRFKDDIVEEKPSAEIPNLVVPAATIVKKAASGDLITPEQMEEETLAWEQNERLLGQADEEVEAEAEADATEVPRDEWRSLMPQWLTGPQAQEDQEPSDSDDAPPTPINWSLTNDDGSTNWGLVVFVIQATACAGVWVGLVATLGFYRFARRARCTRGRFATPADSHLMTPLMYEPPSKVNNTAQLYEDLYHIEDAKLHADNRQYVAIQYEPLKSEK